MISEKRREEVINKLEVISESKYKIGDYKGAKEAKYQAKQLINSNSHIIGLETRFMELIKNFL